MGCGVPILTRILMGRVFRSKHVKLKIAIFMYIKIPFQKKKNRGNDVPLVGKALDISYSANRLFPKIVTMVCNGIKSVFYKLFIFVLYENMKCF
jgi:hypothetical protein